MPRIVKSAAYEARNVVLGPFYENDKIKLHKKVKMAVHKVVHGKEVINKDALQ